MLPCIDLRLGLGFLIRSATRCLPAATEHVLPHFTHVSSGLGSQPVESLRSAAPAWSFVAAARGFAAAPIPKAPPPGFTTSQGASPLLQHPPRPRSAPLPSLVSCPDTAALASHIQRHGPQYSLAHVAAGFQVLAALAPRAPSPASTPSPATPQPDGSTAGPPPTSGARGARALPVPASTVQCAQRLSILGKYAMREGVDVASMAECLGALSGLDEEARGGELAVTFLKELRAARYYFALQQQQPGVLVALLHQLGKVRPWQKLDYEARGGFRQVVNRVVKTLSHHVLFLSADDAAVAVQALARLEHGRSRLPEAHLLLLQALARHLVKDLLPQDTVTPEAAIKLLWSYARLLPGACADADDAGPAASAQRQRPRSSAAAGPAAPQGAAAPAAPASAPAAELVEAVVPLVAALCRVVCRALDSAQPIELFKLVAALGRLGATREAGVVLPQATPPLLRGLAALDNSALADVARAFHSLGAKEPGLLGAIGDQIVASGVSLKRRDICVLMPCYGVGGSATHAALWALLRKGLREQALEPYILPKVLPTLDRTDPEDADLAARLEAQLQQEEAEQATQDSSA